MRHYSIQTKSDKRRKNALAYSCIRFISPPIIFITFLFRGCSTIAHTLHKHVVQEILLSRIAGDDVIQDKFLRQNGSGIVGIDIGPASGRTGFRHHTDTGIMKERSILATRNW